MSKFSPAKGSKLSTGLIYWLSTSCRVSRDRENWKTIPGVEKSWIIQLMN